MPARDRSWNWPRAHRGLRRHHVQLSVRRRCARILQPVPPDAEGAAGYPRAFGDFRGRRHARGEPERSEYVRSRKKPRIDLETPPAVDCSGIPPVAHAAVSNRGAELTAPQSMQNSRLRDRSEEHTSELNSSHLGISYAV